MSVTNERISTLPATATAVVQSPQLMSAVEQAIATSPYLPLRNLRCDYHEGVVTLRGKVPTFYLKQLAQTLVQRINGVEQVANRIEVVEPGRR